MSENTIKSGDKNNKLIGSLFFGSLTFASVLFGFSTAIAAAKRKDVNAFTKGLTALNNSHAESGASLAVRALGWGTAYACSGFAIFCFTVWKVLGVNDLREFRMKVGSYLPVIPKSANGGRTEFESLRDLLQYVIDESDKQKRNNNDNNNGKNCEIIRDSNT